MRHDGRHYTTACGHKKAPHGKQAALPARRVEGRGDEAYDEPSHGKKIAPPTHLGKRSDKKR